MNQYKHTLKVKVGNFASQNSIPHITITELKADIRLLEIIIKKLKRISHNTKPFHALFYKIIISQLSKTVFLLPNILQPTTIHNFLKVVRLHLNLKNKAQESKAQINIGRELNAHQIESAENLFPEVNLNVECCLLGIRKYNRKTGQFEILQTFPFLVLYYEGQPTLF